MDELDASDPIGAQVAIRDRARCVKDATVDGIGYVFQEEVRRCLGGRDDYKIVQDSRGKVRAAPKVKRDREIWHIADLIPIVFNEYHLDVEDALMVAHMVMVPVQACSVPFGEKPVEFGQPADAAHAENLLHDVFTDHFLDMARTSVKKHDPAAALTSLKRQLETENDKWKNWPTDVLPIEKTTYYSIALESLIGKQETEITWKIEENRARAEIGLKSVEPPTPGPTAEGEMKTEGVCQTCGKGEKYTDRNLERTVLFLSVVFDELKIKADTKQQIDAARIITGYSGNTIKPLMYKSGTNEKKEMDAPNAYRKDFAFISDLFAKLNRSDLAQKVLTKQ